MYAYFVAFIYVILASSACANAAKVEMPLVRIPHVPKRSMNIRSNGDVPLRGDLLTKGEYYVQLEVGQPPRPFIVQVDTGSSDLLIPSANCTGCSYATNFYDLQRSTTGKTLTNCSNIQQPLPGYACAFKDEYGDGSSASAFAVSDTVSIGSYSAQNQLFGAIFETKGMSGGGGSFEPQGVDGLLGIAYPSISQQGAPTLMDNIMSQHSLPNLFSMCMGTGGGMMTLGEIGTYYTGNFQYTPIIKSSGYYQIKMTDMQVQGHSIKAPANSLSFTIVDSGSTAIMFPQTVYSYFTTAMQSVCDTQDITGLCGDNNIFSGYCFELSDSDIASYPTLNLVFPDANNTGSFITINISPQLYLLTGACPGHPTFYTSGVFAAGDDVTPIILGDVFMRGFLTVFDRADNKLGFATVDSCPSYNPPSDSKRVAFIVLGVIVGAIVVIGLVVLCVVRYRKRRTYQVVM